ncbi:hypothetical protein JCM16303_003914 [Sporobolomyces ruberrimus]
MAHLSTRLLPSLSPQPPHLSSNSTSYSPSDMTTPLPLQAGPRKLKKRDNVKNRVSTAFRKTFSKPPIEAKILALVDPARRHPTASPSCPLPSYASASSSPSRGYFGPVPIVVRQGSNATATRESGRSNKPQTLAAEGLVHRRSHIGAGAVGTSPPLPAIPLPPTTVIFTGETKTTFRPPVDGLGIGLDLDLSPTQLHDRSPSLTPRSISSPEFPVLANVSHVQPSVSTIKPLSFENSRARLVRTRASISAPSDFDATVKQRGANRANATKCYTVASYPTTIVPLARPPKSTLRIEGSTPEPVTPEASPVPPPPPPRTEAPAVGRTAPFSRNSSVVTATAPISAGLYCLRPSVNASTQTPEWPEPRRPSTTTTMHNRTSRRFSASTPPQAYSSMFAVSDRTPFEIVPPSPSVYSMVSVDTHRGVGAGHRKGESYSSFCARTEDIREGDEDLQAAIDRHLGELVQSQAAMENADSSAALAYDIPFLELSPYDTPQLRPFEIPPTPLALPPSNSTLEGHVPSPALTAGAMTPTLDQTPTLPPARSTRTPSPAISIDRPLSPSSSTSRSSSDNVLTPPTSAASSTFEDVSIRLAEQEPIQFRKASLVSSSSRKSSLVLSDCSSGRHSLNSRPSSISVKSVKFNLVDRASPVLVTISPAQTPTPQFPTPTEDPESELEPLPQYLNVRRRSESDKPIPRLPQQRTTTTMSREERAARGRSYFLVQALLGEEVPQEGLIRDWARDSEDEESDDDGSIADSEM